MDSSLSVLHVLPRLKQTCAGQSSLFISVHHRNLDTVFVPSPQCNRRGIRGSNIDPNHTEHRFVLLNRRCFTYDCDSEAHGLLDEDKVIG